MAICSSQRPGNNNSRIPGTVSRDPEHEIGSLETEKGVHSMHGTLETGLQPGGPHKGGPADFLAFPLYINSYLIKYQFM